MSADRRATSEHRIEHHSNGYRSFYVNDGVFARFRAAVHWTSRRPDAIGRAPENMSAAIEQYMEQLATRLEKEFNNGEQFPSIPPQRRRQRETR